MSATPISNPSPAAPRVQGGPRPRPRHTLGRVLLYLLCTVLAVLFLFPIAASILTSVKTPQEAAAVPPVYFPSSLSFANYFKLNL